MHAATPQNKIQLERIVYAVAKLVITMVTFKFFFFKNYTCFHYKVEFSIPKIYNNYVDLFLYLLQTSIFNPITLNFAKHSEVFFN
jgi:hypothetical protein